MHKQKKNFFEGFDAAEIINALLVDNLIKFMEENSELEGNHFPELDDESRKRSLIALAKLILEKYESDFYSGFRISNNFLCSQRGQIKEISSGPIASVFYRYNSSKELSILANYFFFNLFQFDGFENAIINSKIDYVLHAVNMCDCIFKDYNNRLSIDGLYEILDSESIGNIEPLRQLKSDSNFWDIYRELRVLRNKLAGHMDKSTSLDNLLNKIKDFDLNSAFNFVNQLDKAVLETSRSHIAIQTHYMLNAQSINDETIIKIKGIQNQPYF